jgi:hypothetical protein
VKRGISKLGKSGKRECALTFISSLQYLVGFLRNLDCRSRRKTARLEISLFHLSIFSSGS